MTGVLEALAGPGDAAIAVWKATFWLLVHGTVLAAIALALVHTALRRARPAIVAAVWAVVLVKFLVPVGPALPWSLSSAVASALDALAGGGPAPARHALPADLAAAPAAGAAAGAAGLAGLVALAGLAAWAAGAAILVARRIREQRALRRLAGAAAPAGAEVVALVGAVAARLGLRRAPAVRIDRDGAVPWVLGPARPVLVLPAALAAGDRAALAAVVGHELAHLRRRDAWLRLLQVAAGAIFFYWPVVRWVSRRVDAARELACDAWAVERGPLPAHAYARVLVGLVRARAAAPAGALALAAHPGLLARRVDALVGRGRPPRAGVGAAGGALLAGWTVIALAGAARAEPRAPLLADECRYSPELAARILTAHPEADADGDGELTRDEACEFQLELGRRTVVEAPAVSLPEPLRVEGLCCNCAGTGEPSAAPALAEPTTCTQD